MTDANDIDDIDAADDDAEDYSLPAPDPFTAVIALCRLAASPKSAEAMLRRIRKAERAALAAEQKSATAEAKLEQKQAALDVRAAELDAREVAISEREAAFETACAEAHDHLREYHSSIAEEDRSLRYRILRTSDLLHGFNEKLQMLPDWSQIKAMLPGLPLDPPAPVAEVSQENSRQDWTGHTFLSTSTLTRTVNKAADQ